MSTQPTRTCEKCGGTITADEIVRRQAGLIQGKLHCVACVDAIRQQYAMSRSGILRTSAQAPGDAGQIAHEASHGGGSGLANAVSGSGLANAVATSAAPPPAQSQSSPGNSGDNHGDATITLVAEQQGEQDQGTRQESRKITSFAEKGLGVGARAEHAYHRGLVGRDQGATRCRTFHAKLTDPAIAYMDNQINEWLDAHPEYYIKHATTTIGVFEGKHAEQHLIVTVYY